MLPFSFYGRYTIVPSPGNILVLKQYSLFECGFMSETKYPYGTDDVALSNASMIYLVQNLFQKGRVMRTLSLNMHYFVLFKNYRDQLQIQTFGRQAFPQQLKYFIDAFDKATSSVPYGYLVSDMNPHSNKLYCLRTRIFPGEGTIRAHYSSFLE
jgi:hypothetical protein